MPVANRTRYREALKYKELHESIRKKKRLERYEAESSSFGVDKHVAVKEKVSLVEGEEEINVEEVEDFQKSTERTVFDVSEDEDLLCGNADHEKRKNDDEECGDDDDDAEEGEEEYDDDGDDELRTDDKSWQEGGKNKRKTRKSIRRKRNRADGKDEDEVLFLGRDDSEVKTGDRDIIQIDVDVEESEKDDDDDDVESSHKACGQDIRKSTNGKYDNKSTNFSKRKHKGAVKDDYVHRILVNSVLHTGEIASEYSLCSGSEVLEEERSPEASKTSLPLKFTFGIEESTPPERSEYEEELDNLWTEMDFALKASEIGSSASPMDVNGTASSRKVEHQSTGCLQGNHQLILDDEIGIRCKLCSFVKLEIRYVAPSFFKCPMERSGWSYSNTVNNSMHDELHTLESDFDSQFGCCSHHHAEGTVWDLIPGVKNSMFPHQREGFEFIWKKIAGGINLHELKNSTSLDCDNGCIISHAPGTGKTRLTIVFLDSYIKLYPNCRPVIVAPRSMLLTWEEEFQKWGINTPFHNLNKRELCGKENDNAASLMDWVKYGRERVHLIRMVKLYSWTRSKGILGLSYGLFNKIVSEKSRKASKKVGDDVNKILLELPGLFVFDEGHTPRNDETCMFKALSRIKTERRIILSGTPFQNNFQELGNTLSLVFPKFAAKMQFEDRRHNGKKLGRKSKEAKVNLASLMGSIGKGADDGVKDKKLKMLRDTIAPFVHIHKGNVLQESLPGLRHSVVVLQPNDFQKTLLELTKEMKSLFEGDKGATSMFGLDYYVSLISVHPSLVPKRCFKQKAFLVHKDKLERLRLIPEAGIKTKFLMMLLQLSNAMKEKVLVFSEFIRPLNLIMDQLKHSFKWKEGKEVLYMDGKRDVKQRQSSINVFNDPASEARILLASTKACCEGINLVGASRVVLLDVVWNPSVERQAISRAYRLGQKRMVHVYHLITSGTMEEDKICRQAKKVRLSNLVFSSSDGGDNSSTIASGDLQDKLSLDEDGNKHTYASEDLQDKILNEMVQQDKMIENIIQQPKESELVETFGFVDKCP